MGLRTLCSGVVIVAHHEDTGPLKKALHAEGFAVEEVRGPYQPEQLRFSASMRCLVNHANAWRIAAERSLPTLVVEADFVPVTGLGDLPAPLPTDKLAQSIGYLYAVGPQVWDLARPDLARGHGGGMVALLISPEVARLLLQFFEEELQRNPLGAYSPFDTRVGYWLKDRGVQSYIPYRHYGEHGGLGNPEHPGVGLGRTHWADAMQGRLAFLPIYAQGGVFKFWKTRARVRLWGFVRLLYGRVLARRNFARSDRFQMLRFTLGRLLLPSPPR
jgi:hypothetical protein